MTEKEFSDVLAWKLVEEGVFSEKSRKKANKILKAFSKAILESIFDGDEVPIPKIGKIRIVKKKPMRKFCFYAGKEVDFPERVAVKLFPYQHVAKNWDSERARLDDLDKMGEEAILKLIEEYS